MCGYVGSGSRCCAGTPDSEPIRKRSRMLSSGPRPVVVSAAGAAAWALWRRWGAAGRQDTPARGRGGELAEGRDGVEASDEWTGGEG